MKMCHLLMDSSSIVQQMAYRLLQDAAYKRTEYLVVEAGVDTEGLVKAELPIELLEIVQRSLDEGDEFEQDGQVSKTLSTVALSLTLSRTCSAIC
jgi:hypothetical protein